MKAKREESDLSLEALVSNSVLSLGHGEQMSEMQAAVHVGIGKGCKVCLICVAFAILL